MGKNKAKLSKKEFHSAIREKLAGALSDYKQYLGEKKFTTRIKKASRLFSRGVVKLSKKNTPKNKKTIVEEVPVISGPMMENGN